jgi:ribonuclease J
MGLPARSRKGEALADLIAEVVGDTLDGLSKAKRRDPEAVENAVERAVRNTVNQVWGKKPACQILVVEV